MSTAFSPDGKLLANGSSDGSVHFLDLDTGASRRTSLPHAGAVINVAFSPDGRLLATCSWDHTVRLWDVTTGQPAGPPVQYEGTVWSLAFSPDGSTLAVAAGVTTRRVKLQRIPVGPTDEDVKRPPRWARGRTRAETSWSVCRTIPNSRPWIRSSAGRRPRPGRLRRVRFSICLPCRTAYCSRAEVTG